MNIFSIDVEDYYHVLDDCEVISLDQWDNCLPLVEKNFTKLLDQLDRNNTKATCFFLGYIAKRFPHLVKEAANRGHELASHGMYHKLITQMSRIEFKEDITESKKLIEDISGIQVKGFRAPSFSVHKDNDFFFEELVNAGYTYDSSVFPANHDFGGYFLEDTSPFKINTLNGSIIEFPISVTDAFNKRLCYFGGGFLRLFPYLLISYMSKKVNKENKPVIYYIHPREIDPNHPRLKMSFKRYVKSYINLKTTTPKIEKILKNFNCTSFDNYINTKGL